ncbi:hypothetical protein HK102_007446 [Quaeritorhiza haematococci]|nr:hypothetical protein HK102_007446 [Quaeritorhiza haematococci]
MTATNIQDELTTLVLSTLDAPASKGQIKDTGKLTLHGKHFDQLVLRGVLSSLNSREIVDFEQIDHEQWVLTEEGKQVADTGSHEAKVFNAIPADKGISIPEIQKLLGPVAKFGQGTAFKKGWVKKDGQNLVRAVKSIVDQTQVDLKEISKTGTHKDQSLINELKKRKLIEKKVTTTYKVTKGPKFTTTITQESTDITAEMLQSGNWKTATFKKYNFTALGVPPTGGHVHPLLKVREEFRQIFFELGFEEMPTNRFVESSFWNFDALFQPQQHPARDMHDTFFLSDPATDDKFPADYLERVKNVHSVGGYGSIGYRYDWKEEEAQKLILRTHTTAVSSYMLYQLAQKTIKEGVFRPVKYFSIDRVFRNEHVDDTHLAEFHQVEGVVADKGLTLGDLIGILHGFFKKLGIEKLRFKPAYNPYTEPSMEIFSWHEGLNKWVEIGNSGMFRPEMLLPMGLPPDVSVIAWGLSLERPTMIKYGIDNIRELLGHRVDLAGVMKNPICRLDKKMGREK